MAGHAVPKRESGIPSPINEMYITISKSVAIIFISYILLLFLSLLMSGIVFSKVYLLHTDSFLKKIMYPQLFYV